jgi:hypothetical protein
MKKLSITLVTIFAFSLLLIGCKEEISNPTSNNSTLNKFDEFGYNEVAGIFNGPADGVDRNLDGTVWGDPTYANDNLIMKWNNEWDRGKLENWANPPYFAWENNEWNGAFPGGSGEVWHYKIIWVGTELENSAYWADGGYPIWGQFEVIMDQGSIANEHFWYAHANPNGVGLH